MPLDEQLSSAFVRENITRILLVDNAYDPPSVASMAGAFLAYIDSPKGVDICHEVGLDASVVAAAKDALESEHFEVEALEVTQRTLFDKFAEQCDGRYDPRGIFQTEKGVGLQELQPLVSLLTHFDENMDVRTVGHQNAEPHYRCFRPQLV